MANDKRYSLQHSDLNGFLFAEVGVEASGMTLSVLSTLARLDVDPWQEAGRLAKLPRLTAVNWLAGTIARMPSSLWSLADATVIAGRLVSLLPPRGPAIPKSRPSVLPAPGMPRGLKQRIAMAVLMAVMFAGLSWSLAERQSGRASNAANAGWSIGQSEPVAAPSSVHVPTKS